MHGHGTIDGFKLEVTRNEFLAHLSNRIVFYEEKAAKTLEAANSTDPITAARALSVATDVDAISAEMMLMPGRGGPGPKEILLSISKHSAKKMKKLQFVREHLPSGQNHYLLGYDALVAFDFIESEGGHYSGPTGF